jgi:hypothetical protein
MRRVWQRFYADYLFGSRLEEFARLIGVALERGYRYLPMIEFYHLFCSRANLAEQRIFLHRHDIDTDPRTARLLFEIEKAHGIRSTYYFRLSTLDYALMRDIDKYGSEVGYHFEEVATFCKRKGIASPERARAAMVDIRRLFLENFTRLERTFGRKIRSVAAHGDFANRRLGITNSELLDAELRYELGIEFDAYDPEIRAARPLRISDTLMPIGYLGMSPFEAVDRNYPVISLLIHPRHWRTSLLANTRENARRIYEAVHWSVVCHIKDSTRLLSTLLTKSD